MPPCDHNPAPARAVVSLWRARFVLCAALCFAPAAHAIDAGDIVVTSLKGEVQVTMNGGRRDVRPGTVLELPAIVSTGRDGAIDLRQGATSVSVGPDTQLEFPALEMPGGPIDRIQQPRGNAFYDVGKRGSRKLRIETPFLVAVVKGTQFNVATREDDTTIALFEGQLEIRSTDGSEVVDLVAGEIASRHRSEQDIGVIEMDATSAPPVPATPSGAEGGEQAAPLPGAPHEESPPDGDVFLVHEADASPDAMNEGALVDARIDVSDTDTLVAASVVPDIPGVVLDTGSGAVPDDVAGGDTSADPVSPPVVDAVAAPELGGGGSPPDKVTDIPADVDVGAGPGSAVDPAVPVDGAGEPPAVDVGGLPVVDVDVSVDVPVVDGGVGADVDIGVDLDAPGGNSNSAPDNNNGNGNAYGHDKDNANGEANGHDKDDDAGLIGEIVEDVVNLLDDSLRKPGRK